MYQEGYRESQPINKDLKRMVNIKKRKCIILTIVSSMAFILGYNFLQAITVNKKELEIDALQERIIDSKAGTKHDLQGRIDQNGLGKGLRTLPSEAVIQINNTILVMIREIREKLVTANVSTRPFVIPCNQKSIDDTEDLLCMDAPQFDSRYKNPCWYSQSQVFQCLPYFQVIGVDKCGSTDLFDRIAQHPDVIKNAGELGKETMWWSWLRYGHWLKRRVKKKSFQDYLNYFRSAAKAIQKDPSRNYVTGDGTPMDIWDNTGWRSIPQNNGLREPKYITPHLIKHINPNAKFLVILRDPVERLFSDYFFLGLGKMTLDGFHDEVINAIKLLHTCTRTESLRTCLYSRALHLQTKARIALGFYVVFLQDWFQVFPREQFMIIRTEDFANATAAHMHKVFKFLELRNLPPTKMQAISSSTRKYVTKRKKKVGEMKPETRRILKELYGELNQQLSVLLNDIMFMWK